jgi:quinol monooxygenase YgiN
MSEQELAAIGIVRAKPGQDQELGRRMSSLIAPTRAEPGCLAYELFQSTEDPAVWVFIERWRSVADLDAHVHANHMTTFLARSREVLADQPHNFRLRSVPRKLDD